MPKERCALRIESACQEIECNAAAVCLQYFRVAQTRERMIIGDEIKRFALGLQRHRRLHHAKIIANVQSTAWLKTGKNAHELISDSRLKASHHRNPQFEICNLQFEIFRSGKPARHQLNNCSMAKHSEPVSVVTGGAGFLGSHLVDRLLGEGHRVIAIDNLITGNTANIGHLAGNEKFRFIKHNVSNFIFLPEQQIDYVFHFASPASPIDYLELPIPTLKVGALGTHNTLGLAKDKKATFILASTSEVYGDPLVHPQKEDYWGNVNPIGPRGVYDEAKRFGEAMTMAYHRYHRVDTRIVRIFNTYGPRMRLRDGRVVPAFIGQALSGQPLTVFGDGSQTRSFCYVSDLIDGIFRLAMSDFHEPVNLGNPREMSIKQFAEEIIRITGTKSTIEYKPLPVDDPKVRQPDITRAKEILDWEPRVEFEEGIKATIDYFKASLNR